MAKIYRYVGASELLNRDTLPNRYLITNPSDISRWIQESQQRHNASNAYIATFVIDTEGKLWIADRHSEHIHCSRYKEVLSAGEITFTQEKNNISVLAVTNQSTGFCPEPSSWSAVQAALQTAGLNHPNYFTTAFEFRRCTACNTVNIVKEDCFICSVCESDLSSDWNIG